MILKRLKDDTPFNKFKVGSGSWLRSIHFRVSFWRKRHRVTAPTSTSFKTEWKSIYYSQKKLNPKKNIKKFNIKKVQSENLVRKKNAETIRFQSSERKASRKVAKQHIYWRKRLENSWFLVDLFPSKLKHKRSQLEIMNLNASLD